MTCRLRFVVALAVTLVFTGVTQAQRERSQNAYKTHKLALNSVLVSCEDEREPVVRRLEGPFVIVTCETVK